MAKTRQESDWFTALAKRANLAFAAIGFVLVGVLVVLGTVFDERLKEMETSLDVAPMTTAPFDAPLVTTTPTEMPATVVSGQTLYVPAYSHIQHVENRIYLLAVNLSVRNTDASHPITVATVDFYDTNGELVRSYLDSPQELGPLAIGEYVVDWQHTGGGAGATFIVEWVAGEKVAEPLVEAVMVGATGAQAMAFVRKGVVIAEREKVE